MTEKKYLNSNSDVDRFCRDEDIHEEYEDFVFLSLFLDEIIALANSAQPGNFYFDETVNYEEREYCRQEIRWQDTDDNPNPHIEAFGIRYFPSDMVLDLTYEAYDDSVYYNLGVDSPEAFTVRCKLQKLCGIVKTLYRAKRRTVKTTTMDKIAHSFPGLSGQYLLGEDSNDNKQS